ncbi:hypothetical protein [Chitinophaga sp.]|uniref:hypothetical protein n=1 Tax=Chitinophaga sp. TaxID=1869181 RepID=UPI0031D6F94C
MRVQYLVLLAFVVACSKGTDKPSSENEAPEKEIETFHVVHMTSYNLARGFDTTDNYINEFYFLRKERNAEGYLESKNLGGYIGSRSEESKYLIRYTGGQPLFHLDNVIGRGGEGIDFRINPDLKGKTIFEVYDKSTGQIAKKFVASKDSASIEMSFSIWDNFYVPDKQIGEAFLYYIQKKQTDAIVYRKR